MKNLTHIGREMLPYLRRSRLIQLRETPKYWIDAYGTKFRKEDGRIPGKSNVNYLKLESIEKLTDEVNDYD